MVKSHLLFSIAAAAVLAVCIVFLSTSSSSSSVVELKQKIVVHGADPMAHMPKYLRIRYEVEQQIRKKLDERTAQLAGSKSKSILSAAASTSGHYPHPRKAFRLTRAKREQIARKIVDADTDKVAKLMFGGSKAEKSRRVSVKAAVQGKLLKGAKKHVLASKEKALFAKEEAAADRGLSHLLTRAIIKKQKQEERNWLVSEEQIKAQKENMLKRLQRTKMIWKKTQLRAKERAEQFKKLIHEKKGYQKIEKSLESLNTKPGKLPTKAQVHLAQELQKHILEDSKQVDEAVKDVRDQASRLGLNKPIGEQLAQRPKKGQKEARSRETHWNYLWDQK